MIFGRRRAASASGRPALTVPPFAPDPPVEATGPQPVADPIGALRAAGVELEDPARVDAVAGIEIWQAPVEPGYGATEVWERIAALHRTTGWWPVVATSSTVRSLGDGSRGPRNPSGDGQAWLTAERASIAQMQRGEATMPTLDYEGELEWDDVLAAAPPDLDRLLLIPAAAGWLAPGVAQWSGAVNYSIEGEDHATILRRWHGLYGADLVGLSSDVVIVRVLRPPRTEPEALAFAVEVSLYCSAALYTQDKTLDSLAAELFDGPLLVLWWD